MLFKNANRRMIAVGHLLAHASDPNISNARKSAYFRSAAILLTTVIEAFTYDLVKRKTTYPHVIDTYFEHKERHRISSKVFNTTGNLTICEKTTKDQLIDDEGMGFGKYIIFLKNKGLLTKSEYNLLNWARTERNKIHLQGMNTADTGYTNKKINKLAEAILIFANK